MIATQLLKSFVLAQGLSERHLREDGLGMTLDNDEGRVDFTIAETGHSMLLTGFLGPVPDDPVLKVRMYDGLMVAQGINLTKPYLSFAVQEHDGEDQVVLLQVIPVSPATEQEAFDELVTRFLEDYDAYKKELVWDFIMTAERSTKPPAKPTTFTSVS